MLILESPIKLRIVGYESRIEEVRKALTFKRSSRAYEYERFKKNKWAARNMAREDYVAKLDEMKSNLIECLLFEDENGYWTYAGLKDFIQERFGQDDFISHVEYPEPQGLAWDKIPEHTLRPYQQESIDKLMAVKHGAIELCVGGGKSFIILNLVRLLGLQTIVVAPTESIATQLYEEFSRAFGKRYVGMMGAGKRVDNKLITIAITASLVRVNRDDLRWDHLSKVKVLVIDESQICPSETLESVCHGVAKNAPYRFFVSGTQMRNDGADLLLNAIIGPIVFRKSLKEAVDEGWLARPRFKMISLTSQDPYYSDDPGRMTRHHFLKNPQVIRAAAKLTNNFIKYMGHRVLILVDDLPQITPLLPLLNYEVRFAHGGVTKANSTKVPKEFHKSNPVKLVKEFDAGEFPILVGTSCINTGTNILTVDTVINLQGGKSPIKFIQSVGRGVRKTSLRPEKQEFNFIDFMVRNENFDQRQDLIYRHALQRADIYDDIYGPVEITKG